MILNRGRYAQTSAMILANQGASSKYHFERLLTGLFTFHQQNKGVQIRLWLGNYLVVFLDCLFRPHQELLRIFLLVENLVYSQIFINRANFENSSSNLFGHLHRKESTGQTFHFPSWIIPVSMIRWFRKLNIINFIIDKTKMIYFSIYIIYLRRVFKMMLTTLSESWKVYRPIKKRYT